VLASAPPAVELRHLEFVSLAERRVLLIVVTAGGQVINKVIETQESVDTTFLQQAANYVNHEFAGLTIEQAREAIVERLQQERILYDALMARALRLARSGLSGITPGESLHVQGASFLVDELLGTGDDRDRTLETLRALFRMIEQKHHLIELLTQYIDANDLTVVIGSEHESPDLHPFSVVASTFRDGQRAGAVGIIGPRRMRYQRAIAVVDGVSQVMTRVLEDQ
jgi:heat-inducible transcriptional repressor